MDLGAAKDGDKKKKALNKLRNAAAQIKVSISSEYRGTWLIRNSAPLGPYSSNMPRALWRP